MEASENSNMASNVLVKMQKSIILILLLGAGFSLSAQTNSKMSFFVPPVTGIGKNQSDNAVIAKMLGNEIKVRNCILASSLQKADLILYGTLAPYHEEEQYYHDYIYLNAKDTSTTVTTYTYNSLLQNSPEQAYIFQLILKNEKTNEAMLLQNLLYHSIDDIYDFFPLLMYNLFSLINGEQTSLKQAYTDDWQNKWLYLRASFDFPITFNLIKNNGLIEGYGIYNKTLNIVQQLDNKVVALPAATLGAEVQLLNWFSIEPKFQIGWEHLNDEDIINMAAGLELKFPLKFIRNVMLEPYGAVVYPVFLSSEIFTLFPLLAFGGGLQISTKAGKSGAIFIDINYMYYSFGDVVVKNPYIDLYPEPDVIHYQRSVIGLGFGYKFGLIDRK
jgi:hypothetical protein